MSVICVLCFIVVPLPPGKNPFIVKINNSNKQNNNNNNNNIPEDRTLRIVTHFGPLEAPIKETRLSPVIEARSA
jgi:hypothetical protein